MKATLILASTTTLMLVACATSPSENRYQSELDALDADCQARGGILSPRGAATYTRPQTDYVCQITGGSSGRIGN